jgi:hypothetical protein
LRPAFEGKPLARTQPIFWEHEGNRGVLDGRWKLVALSGEPWRLYDKDKDRTEQQDLASAEPQKLKELAAKWDAYAARANVLPLGGWRASGSKAAARKGNTASQQKRFTLKSGDHIDRDQSPAVAGHGFTITARFDAKGGQGVIVAQGGAARGYTLFLQDGKLTFLLRKGKQAGSVATPEALSTGPHTVVARLAAGGELSLSLDGKPAATASGPGLIEAMPTDGLDVGSDKGGLVGSYTGDNQFSGSIESVIIELAE